MELEASTFALFIALLATGFTAGIVVGLFELAMKGVI
jgi:hypothetical protein